MEEFIKIWTSQPLMNPPEFIGSQTLMESCNTFKLLHGTFRPIFSSDSSDHDSMASASSGNEEDNDNGVSPAKQAKGRNLRSNTKDSCKKKKKKKKKNRSQKKNNGQNLAQDNGNVNVESYIPGLKPTLRYPSFSSLSTEEHALFLRLMEQFRSQQQPAFNPEWNKEMEIYRKLHERVSVEQADFLNHVKQMWGTSVNKHNYIHPDVNKYVQQVLQSRIKRVKTYPTLYQPYNLIPLVYPADQQEILMQPVCDLLMMGTIPVLLLPTFKEPMYICTDYPRMALRHPPDDADPSTDTLHKVPVSRDKNAERLAAAQAADIVISFSALRCIADNHLPMFDRIWDIPVDVRQYTVKEGNSTVKKNIVFVDNPLPPTSMTALERSRWYHKLGIKLFMCHPKHMKAYRFPDSRNSCGITSESSDTPTICKQNQEKSHSTQAENTLCPDCCSFSIETKISNCKVSKNKVAESDTESNCSEDTLVIDLEALESCKPKKKKAVAKKEEQPPPAHPNICTCGSNLRNNPKERPSDLNTSQETSTQGNVEPITTLSSPMSQAERTEEDEYIPPAPGTNVVYRLWKLCRSTRSKEELNEVSLKGQGVNSGDLKVIIRNKIDVCENNPENLFTMGIFTKMEHQSEYGAEVMNLSELTQQWLKLYFNPSSHLARVRVDAMTSEVLLVERRTLRDIALDGNLQAGRVRKAALGTLYSVLNGLAKLPEGKYLVSHSSRTGAFVNVQLSTSSPTGKQECYNLLKDYMSHDINTIPVGSMPWIQIDPNIVTLRHKRLNQIPAMFDPNPVKTKPKKGPEKKKAAVKKKYNAKTKARAKARVKAIARRNKQKEM